MGKRVIILIYSAACKLKNLWYSVVYFTNLRHLPFREGGDDLHGISKCVAFPAIHGLALSSQ